MQDGGETAETTYRSISLRPSTILLTSDITTTCSTSNFFTFTWIWKSQEWRWLRWCARMSQVFLTSDLPLVFFSTTHAFPFDWAGVPAPHPRSSQQPRWVSQSFCWGWPWLMVEPSFQLSNCSPLLWRASSVHAVLVPSCSATWPPCIRCKPCQSHMCIRLQCPPSCRCCRCHQH